MRICSEEAASGSQMRCRVMQDVRCCSRERATTAAPRAASVPAATMATCTTVHASAWLWWCSVLGVGGAGAAGRGGPWWGIPPTAGGGGGGGGGRGRSLSRAVAIVGALRLSHTMDTMANTTTSASSQASVCLHLPIRPNDCCGFPAFSYDNLLVVWLRGLYKWYFGGILVAKLTRAKNAHTRNQMRHIWQVGREARTKQSREQSTRKKREL